MSLDVCFTVDVEPDCPPFLTGYRGIATGLPLLLELLDELRVPSTFFTTGEIAQRFPEAVESIVRAGHELGSHGMWHRRFTTLDEPVARLEIEQSADILRAFAPVASFRAPNLSFPDRYVPLLRDAGFRLDSSQAKYKWSGRPRRPNGSADGLTRVPASVTSSVLRLPRAVRDPWLRRLASPVVLFVHPWEFVDLRKERLRYDCRFRTGTAALACTRAVLEDFAARGARFRRMGELAERPASAGSLPVALAAAPALR